MGVLGPPQESSGSGSLTLPTPLVFASVLGLRMLLCLDTLERLLPKSLLSCEAVSFLTLCLQRTGFFRVFFFPLLSALGILGLPASSAPTRVYEAERNLRLLATQVLGLFNQ